MNIEKPKELTVTKFLAMLNDMQKEIGCDGEKTAAHTYPSRVSFVVDDADDDSDYVISELEADVHHNCMCWVGIRIHLKKVKE
jgi:hypothetical protein